MLELEAVKVGLETLLYEDLELKNKQWRYLSRRVCRVSELQEICNSSLHKMRSILECYRTNRIRFKRST